MTAYFANSLLKSLEPPPVLNLSEWADKYRILSSKASAEPGKWRTDRVPFAREIMDCLSDHSPYREVVFMKSSQVSGTEIGLNWLGYIIDHCPAPSMIVWPNENAIKRNSTMRLDPLIESTPQLSEKVSEKKSRDGENTKNYKGFPGGFLVIASANSPTDLSSTPAKNILLDEVDRFKGDIAGEGSPISLALGRTKTFTRRKIFYVSTPVEASKSNIAPLFEDSDKRYYFVPCPHCDHYQRLVWALLKWDKGNPNTAHYICENCDKEIHEHHKTKMLALGKWIAERPGHRRGKVAGFHISALYSPLGWISWADLAEEWESIQSKSGQEKIDKLKSFVNIQLGETWEDEGDAPDWVQLYHKRENYSVNTLPEGVVFLTCGVDVQKDRFELEIVGWGEGFESWSIDYRVIPADMNDDKCFRPLDELMLESWGGQNIRMLAIDSGYNTQMVYNWVRKYKANRVVAIKGSESMATILGHPKAADIRVDGKVVRRGLKVWNIGVNHLKDEIYRLLDQDKPIGDEPYPLGYCHFPEYDEHYFKMLTAEQKVAKIVRGYKKYEYQKIRERNEALDCRVYARAAGAILGMDRWRSEQWRKMKIGVQMMAPAAKIEKKQEIVNKKSIKRRDSSFW